MELLGRLSPAGGAASLDEAFVDLEAGGVPTTRRRRGPSVSGCGPPSGPSPGSAVRWGSPGSKMLAKIASEEAKPDGLLLIEPGTERELLAPMSVRTLPGRRTGHRRAPAPRRDDHGRRPGGGGRGGARTAARQGPRRRRCTGWRSGYDDRPVVAERDAKSVSVEDTFDVDLHDRVRVRTEVDRLADRCVQRLRARGRSGRTVVLKVRRYDFSTLTRSETLRGPTDDPAVVREAAARLLEAVDTTGGVRLLGVGVTGLADYTQEDLFAQAAARSGPRGAATAAARRRTGTRRARGRPAAEHRSGTRSSRRPAVARRARRTA